MLVRTTKPVRSTANRRSRTGLILLVVLGMLALFSLLSVTYVVFSSQSRAASIALAQSQIRGKQNRAPVLEEAIMSLVRGPTIRGIAMNGHSLLGDLYGDRESLNGALAASGFSSPMRVTVRDIQYEPTGSGAQANVTPLTYLAGSLQRPMVLAGHYLRIPLDPVCYRDGSNVHTMNLPTQLPVESDVLNGRVVTFLEGNGPLGGQSFHIVRYMGLILDSNAHSFAQSYSVVIDLNEADLSRSYSSVDAATNTPITMSAGDWISAVPPVVGVGSWAAGVYACYGSVSANAAFPNLSNGFELMINAAPLNSHGVGVLNDGTSQYHQFNAGAVDPTQINTMPTAFQPNYEGMVQPSALVGGLSGALTNDGTASYLPAAGGYLGDSDEPYDAADYQNMFLSYTESGASSPEAVIPSFHRASLITYIVNWKDPSSWTELEFLATLRRIQLAMIRPVSFNVSIPAGNFRSHPEFSGSNPTSMRLDMTLSAWGDWPTTGWPIFRQWLDHLTQGPWDVDSNNDGLTDALWVDPGLPLQTTSEGKLVKALAAYYVEDLDSKLDINAISSLAHTNDRPNIYGVGNQFSVLVGDPSFSTVNAGTQYFAQGMGYGPAETSLRHLFSKSPLFTGRDAQEAAHQRFIQARYNDGSSIFPGTNFDDPISLLDPMRERRVVFTHGNLPGLPTGPNGRISIGLDRLGNPLMWNIDNFINESVNDPYEARLLSAPLHDVPFTMAEWERIYRIGDQDRSALPQRLEELFGEDSVSIASSNLRHEITPISRHLRLANLAARSAIPGLPAVGAGNSIYKRDGGNVDQDLSRATRAVGVGPSSLFQTINSFRLLRAQPPLTEAAFRALFPLEFNRAQPMNLNRPFGNGIDDDGDGDIDEPNEFFTNSGGTLTYVGQEARYANGSAIVGTGVGENYFESSNSSPDFVSVNARLTSLGVDPEMAYGTTSVAFMGQETRQIYARHLYCLAQLILPRDYAFPSIDRTFWQTLIADERTSGSENLQLTNIRARILAQWAVNVVDFRDSDSAMTRFPYDPNPFDNGFVWNPRDGVTAPAINVVWGMEQPELLITESLAFHDTKVREDPDASPARFDQFRTPEGSLFLEFYCPRTTALGANGAGTNQLAQGVSSTLYTTNANGTVALNVSRLTPTVPGFTSVPVYRVYITEPKDIAATQALPTPNSRLMSTDPAGTSRRHDLHYQIPESNYQFDASGPLTSPNTMNLAAASGLYFDGHPDPAEQLPAPDPANSRVLVFTGGFTPSFLNSPGVSDPDAQVFSNQGGDLALSGGQYLVVGPRDVTYFGSKSASEGTGSGPVNQPNAHRIVLDSGNGNEALPAGTDRGFDWARIFMADNTEVTQRGTMADCLTMVAAADAPSTWTSGDARSQIGLNVSEPLPNTSYYAEPTHQVNPNDMTGDPSVGASGFGDLPYDGYHDYSTAGRTAALEPFDDKSAGPLQHWDPDGDQMDTAGADFVDLNGDSMLSGGDVVAPGTQLDWSTAYLQRVADPNKPFHPTFNPYITVDWIPIDLTVFNGEDDDSQFDPAGDIVLASRQKTGQAMTASALAYDTSAGGAVGNTFMSLMTDKTSPTPNTKSTTATANFWQYELDTDIVSSGLLPARPTAADGNDSFCTLGFLNSTYKLSGQDSTAFPPRYRGAPTEPTAGGSTFWHPAALFWADRSFTNSHELMWVPTSGPCTIMQEFTAEDNPGSAHSPYASAYANNDTGGSPPSFMPEDPRTPASPRSPDFPGFPGGANPNIWLSTSTPPIDGVPNTGLTVSGTQIEPIAHTPFAYLLNFFQEPTERVAADTHPGADTANHLHSKELCLANLLDLVDTPSPWSDAYQLESPGNLAWQDYTTAPTDFQPVVAAENIIFGPMRAPYNGMPKYVEPGRVNLNTVSEPNVMQGLVYGMLTPSDVDFAPYTPTQTFPFAGDIDHDGDGVVDNGSRTSLFSTGNTFMTRVWPLLESSRRGFDQVTGAYGFFTSGFPRYNPDPTRFNPHFPTRFANVFRPASEAGMVPWTRNPLPFSPLMPGDAGYDVATHIQFKRIQRLAQKRGILDLYARMNPAMVTLLRPSPLPSFSGHDINGDSNPDSVGILEVSDLPATRPLFSEFRDDNENGIPDINETDERNPFLDFYGITRMEKLTTNRSNVFAVYVTVGLFEYDETNDEIGREYGADRGEQQRFRAFYVIDRSIPVAFETGVDHNAANTIIVRRLLNSEDEQ